MGTFGGLWAPLGAYGDLWGPMGTHGHLGGPLGTYGHLWGPMGTFGGLWGPMGAYGCVWGPMGTSPNEKKQKGRTQLKNHGGTTLDNQKHGSTKVKETLNTKMGKWGKCVSMESGKKKVPIGPHRPPKVPIGPQRCQ